MVEGPLAPYFEPYAEYLADQGYSQVSYWKKTFLINEFSRWLSWEGISVNEVTAAHEEAFLRDRARHRCLKRGDGIALSGVTDCYRRQDYADISHPKTRRFLPLLAATCTRRSA